jgi:beta-lactamase superfamily II metal-dependent hydrolase
MLIGDLKLWRETDLFKIEMLPAGHGDCIYLEYGEPRSPHHVLIDGGPYYAFKPLARRIKEMVRKNLVFDLLVITHVDCDHIDGMLKLLGANLSSLRNCETDIWFNSWRHMAKEPLDVLGPPHGEMLGALLEEKALAWNREFGGEAVANPDRTTLLSKELAGGLKLTLLSPTKAELVDLKKVWVDEVRKAGLEPGSREQALRLLRRNLRLSPRDLLGEKPIDVVSLSETEFEGETSETNASSIAFLAEYDGKKCIFAGDAQPDVLSASIQQLLVQRGEGRLKVDAFKLSHHGSSHNTSLDLLRLLDCKKFLVSSNGNIYHHPDRETIGRIIVESGPDLELFFNYHSDENKVWGNEAMWQRFRYKAHYPKEGKEGLVVSL